MAKHRTHSIEFKRQVAQDFIAGDANQIGWDRLSSAPPSKVEACWGSFFDHWPRRISSPVTPLGYRSAGGQNAQAFPAKLAGFSRSLL